MADISVYPDAVCPILGSSLFITGAAGGAATRTTGSAAIPSLACRQLFFFFPFLFPEERGCAKKGEANMQPPKPAAPIHFDTAEENKRFPLVYRQW